MFPYFFGRLAGLTFTLTCLGGLTFVGCRAQNTPFPSQPPAPPATQQGSQQGNQRVDQRATPATRTGDRANLLLGNPSNASNNSSNKASDGANNFLLERPQHAMSYNATNGVPNWVSWHLEASDLGNTDRSSFRPDPLLPENWQIRPADYKGSGYDRGHICPSGDRTANVNDNQATFVMSNMLPQTAALNQRVWKDLEDYSRQLVEDGSELYTVAGGVGSAGRVGGKINVPKACWKVIVVLPAGTDDLNRIGRETRVIAVMIPNTDDVGNTQWPQWATSVAKIEAATRLNLLDALPDEIEQALEDKVDRGEF